MRVAYENPESDGAKLHLAVSVHREASCCSQDCVLAGLGTVTISSLACEVNWYERIS